MKTNDILLQSIKTLIQQEIEKAPFNKTKQGIITKNYMDGTYDVRFDGNLYTKILTYPNSTSLQLGQTVKIIIPNNQSSQMYISAEGSPLIYYPVGSYYETSDSSFDPNTAWGGTWEKSTHISEEESLLYTGSFTTGSITLNDDVKNYWRIAVTANDNDGSVKTFNVINDYANFYTYLDFQCVTGAWYVKTMIVTFDGKTMTANSNKQAYFSTVSSEGTYVTVKSIYGYKINTIIGWHRTA